jgi:hypothetical protein
MYQPYPWLKLTPLGSRNLLTYVKEASLASVTVRSPEFNDSRREFRDMVRLSLYSFSDILTVLQQGLKEVVSDNSGFEMDYSIIFFILRYLIEE